MPLGVRWERDCGVREVPITMSPWDAAYRASSSPRPEEAPVISQTRGDMVVD